MMPQRSSDEKDLNPMRRSSRKQRHEFSKKDLEILKQSFEQNPYPDFTTREQLAKQLGCYLIELDTWFQNKRARLPREERQRLLANRKLYKKLIQDNLNLGCTDAQETILLDSQSCYPLEKQRISGKESVSQCDPVVKGRKMWASYTLEHHGETRTSPSSGFSSPFCIHFSTSELYFQKCRTGFGESQLTPPSFRHFNQRAQRSRRQQQQQQGQPQTNDYYSSLQGQEQNGWEYLQHLPQLQSYPEQQPCQNQFLMQQNPQDLGQQLQQGQVDQFALCSQMQLSPLHMAISSPPVSPTENKQAASTEEPGKQYH